MCLLKHSFTYKFSYMDKGYMSPYLQSLPTVFVAGLSNRPLNAKNIQGKHLILQLVSTVGRYLEIVAF